jgi:hypothetical protein
VHQGCAGLHGSDEATIVDKRPNVRRPPEREEMAADRHEQQSYPTNNFAVTAIILVGLIVVIGLAVAFGLVK